MLLPRKAARDTFGNCSAQLWEKYTAGGSSVVFRRSVPEGYTYCVGTPSGRTLTSLDCCRGLGRKRSSVKPARRQRRPSGANGVGAMGRRRAAVVTGVLVAGALLSVGG